MFTAMGLVPVRVWGAAIPSSAAHGRLQGYVCSVVATALELALRGDFDDLAGLFLPSPCDSVNNLVDLLRSSLKPPFIEAIAYPQRGTPGALEYLASELRRLHDAVGTATGHKATPESWQAAIRAHNRTRALMRDMYGLRARGACPLDAETFYRVVRVSGHMERTVLNAMLERLLDALRAARQDPGPARGPGVVLSGIMAEPPGVARMLDESGLNVAHDDLALGSRLIEPDVSETGDPSEAVARRYLDGPPCSTIHAPEDRRAAHLLDLCRASGTSGVLFLMQKFCEPEYFDLPRLRDALRASGIPSAAVEVSWQSHAGEALRTRLAAFREVLERPAQSSVRPVH
jgi:benzoyl-CoA reductase/2-hydroxyglutaryl-CoA dehydratase subunit BcrC/BadD/HgdB